MTAIFGIDFTSAPRARKAITIARGRLAGGAFALEAIDAAPDWAAFERLLAEPGPWIGGFDFPFGLPREAVRDLGWPADWTSLVAHCRALGRAAFTAELDAYRIGRRVKPKRPNRRTDIAAGSHSPLKCVRPPVGWMFLEGAPRLAQAGVTIPSMLDGDPGRVAIEAYPGFTARQIIGRSSYKQDDPKLQTAAREGARQRLVVSLTSDEQVFGFTLTAAPKTLMLLVEDASGDKLDAAICAMQAAWAWMRRDTNYGLPHDLDPIEGWIATATPGPTGLLVPRTFELAEVNRGVIAPIASPPMDLDALRLALLAVCSPEHALVRRIHGELEHWLNRPLATADIEAALAELEARGLVDADRAATEVTFVTTESGRELVAERWEEFFPA